MPVAAVGAACVAFLLVRATAYRAPNPIVSARAMAIGAMLLSNPSERFVFSILALV